MRSNQLCELTAPGAIGKGIELDYYFEMLEKHIDLVERRILDEEKIPHVEKLFSLFEDHTEWIRKGKNHKSVELGHNMLIASDQYHFIIHHQVIEGQTDSQIAIELSSTLTSKYPGQIDSLSLDKGFYSKLNKIAIQQKIPMVVMPKRGRRNKIETEEERSDAFIKLRYAHSAVESNINQLEYNGLNRCLDKGLNHFKRYAALSVLAYNIHRIGTYVEAREKITPLPRAA